MKYATSAVWRPEQLAAELREAITAEPAAEMAMVAAMLHANWKAKQDHQAAVEWARNAPIRAASKAARKKGHMLGGIVRKKYLGKPAMLRALERTAFDDGMKLAEKQGLYGSPRASMAPLSMRIRSSGSAVR